MRPENENTSLGAAGVMERERGELGSGGLPWWLMW